MPRSCLSPLPLSGTHGNPVQLQVLPLSLFLHSSPCAVLSSQSAWHLNAVAHLLPGCLPWLGCSIPCREGISIALPAVADPISLNACVFHLCVCACVSCVLHLTTFEFKLYKIYDGRAFSHQQREGSFPRVLTGCTVFSGVPHFGGRELPQSCCHWHCLPLIEAQSGATSAAQTLCAIAWRAFNSIGHQ